MILITVGDLRKLKGKSHFGKALNRKSPPDGRLLLSK
jgi:hypothetical protein